MPISSSPSTSKRLLALLSLLQARRDWPARALAQKLEISERTVRRDVDRLRELAYTIDATRGPDGGYRLGIGTQLPPLMLDDDQAVAIAITLRTAATIGADLEDAADRALATISRLMPAPLARRIESIDVGATASTRQPEERVDPGILLRIGEAIRSGEELRFDYDAPNLAADAASAPPVRRTEPHHLLLHAGRWYLIGYSTDRADWRTYRVDRIIPRSHNGRRFVRRTVPGGDPARYLAARFKGSAGGVDTWPCWGEATLRVPIAAVAPYIEDGTVEALGPDVSRVRLGSWSWGALASAFTRFEADIGDVQPEELGRAFAELSDRARAAT